MGFGQEAEGSILMVMGRVLDADGGEIEPILAKFWVGFFRNGLKG